MTTYNRNTRFTRNKTEDISNLLYGKIPPQARELEEAVLGAILIERDAINSVSEILKPESFYVDAHSNIYKAILNLSEKSQPIDILTVVDELKKNGKLEEVGGAYYISELTNKVASSANIEHHASIIYQQFIRRELIRISNDIIRESYEDVTDVFDIVEHASLNMMTIASRKHNNIKTVRQIKMKISKSILTNEPIAKLFSLGFSGLDFLSKTFNVVAGMQGTGKTAFMLSVCKNLALQGIKSGIKSIEMADIMLVARLVQTDTKISSKAIITNTLSEEEKAKYFETDTSNYDNFIYVDDDADVTDVNLINSVKSFVLKHGIEMLFIDYIQLVEILKKGNTTEVAGVEKLTRNLQVLAKELDICIVALSQLVRSNEIPTAKSIRGGGIEQAASDIFILHDEHWVKNDSVKWSDIPQERRGLVNCIYAKGRYTDVGNRKLYFNKPYQTYSDWEEKEVSDYAESFNNNEIEKRIDIF